MEKSVGVMAGFWPAALAAASADGEVTGLVVLVVLVQAATARTMIAAVVAQMAGWRVGRGGSQAVRRAVSWLLLRLGARTG
jgi:hypothetical protein